LIEKEETMGKHIAVTMKNLTDLEKKVNKPKKEKK